MSADLHRPTRRGAAGRRVLRVGTRGSELALRQTSLVIAALRRTDPELQCEVAIIRTQGDDQPEIAFAQFEAQGVFVRRIEAALLAGQVDLAVHSFKDMPSATTPGLTLAALPAREDPRDALVAAAAPSLGDLSPGARVGTGAPRRRALLLDLRPDLQVEPIRGNVDTRLRHVAEGRLDAVVVAAAGLRRLGRADRIAELLDPTIFTPAIGQGILAIQARADDRELIGRLQPLHDPTTHACALAERAVAVAVGAGCQTPVGAYAHVEGDEVVITAVLAGEGRELMRSQARGPLAEAPRVGAEAGAALLESRHA